MLLDLIETHGDKGKWFAAAKDVGFLDIALDCAAVHNAEPSTLVRAARDFCDKEPRFAATVALFAVTHLLAGSGYDPPVSDVNEAIKHLFVASRAIGASLGPTGTWQVGGWPLQSRPRDIPTNRQGCIIAPRRQLN